MRTVLVSALLAACVCGRAAAGAGGFDLPRGEQAAWSLSLSGGFDTYAHTYPLALEDTTEVISEWTLAVGAEGRSPWRARHAWRLRPEVAVGTELVRERLEAGWQYRPDSTAAVLRLDGSWQARQYRGDSEYDLSSDCSESRLRGRWTPRPRAAARGELRLRAARLRYRRPSTLEIDHDEVGGAVQLRSGRLADRRWLVGGLVVRRTYPDSSAIDRTVIGGEAEYDALDHAGGLRAHHRSERRAIRDASTRPSGWLHWSEGEAALPAGAGRIIARVASEIWRYDAETAVYFDSWRVDGVLVYEGGGPLTQTWQLGLALERLEAGDDPETYTQIGLRGGVETFGGDLSGSLTVECGRRDYTLESSGIEPATAVDVLDPASWPTYFSDFTYWELLLMASWSLADGLDLDVMGHYQPESHTEPTDDSAVAFGSVRLIHRF